MREEDYIYVETLPANPQDFKRRTVVLSDGSKFYSDGNLWSSETGGGSATLDANSPIPGNPTALNTPAKLAAAIQALQGFDASIDADADGRVDANKQQNVEQPFPIPVLQWVLPHSLGRVPNVTVLNAAGDVVLADIKASQTSVIVEFGAPMSGRLILT